MCPERYSTSAISSTSTGAFSGSTATPTALRACLPASPKTSPSSSLAPLIDLRLAVEAGRAGHEADHLHDPADLRQPADHGRRRGERVQRAGAGQVGRLLGADLGTDLAGAASLPFDHRHLARGVDEVRSGRPARTPRRRRGDLGQLRPSAASAVLGVGHDFSRFR